MKILAIGDPHGSLDKLKNIPSKNIDLILLTGDIGKADLARKQYFRNQERAKQGLPKLKETVEEATAIHREIHESTLNVLRYLSTIAPVYAIQGNVGISGKSDVKKIYSKFGVTVPSTIEEIELLNNVYITKNVLRRVNDYRIGFLEYFIDTSWVKEFRPAKYRKKMLLARKETKKANRISERFKRVDILVCHQPPYGYLDAVNFPGAPESWQGKHAGSKAILDYVKKYQPKYVFCGHIHEGEGYAKIGKTQAYNLGVAGHKIIEL